MIRVRKYRQGDEYEIVTLFRETIHTINAKDYSQEQLDAWAPDTLNLDKWRQSLECSNTFVAINDDARKIVGFADLNNEGYLDRCFVHKDYQRKNIGTMLLRACEEKAHTLCLKRLYSNVSITAKPFFKRHGYKVEKKQCVSLKGLQFVNYRMIKDFKL